MSILTSFDTDVNFWEAHPQFKIPKAFAEFYAADKSKGKAHSSKIMWAIAFLVDNTEANKFRNMLIEEKKVLIAEDYLVEPKFNWDEYSSLIDAYETLCLSKAEKSLKVYEDKLEERNTFIRDTKYDIDNAKTLDSIISSTKSIFDFIYKLRDDIRKEITGGETKGSMKESASEKGEL